MNKTKKKIKFFKPLIMAIIMVFTVPIFAFASSPSSVTYKLPDGVTVVPSQTLYDTYVKPHPYVYALWDNAGNLQFYASNSPITYDSANNKLTTNGSLFYYATYQDNGGSFGNTTSYTTSLGASITHVIDYVAFTAPPPDTTAPSEITNLVETHNDTSVYFTWTNPTNTDFDHVNIYQGSTKIGTSTNGAFAVSSLTQSTTYSYKLTTVDKTGNESTGTIKSVTTDVTPSSGTNPDTGSDTNNNTNGGILNMFTNLTSAGILTEATSWANNFDDMLLVVVGVGIGFACVRFVKGLFF